MRKIHNNKNQKLIRSIQSFFILSLMLFAVACGNLEQEQDMNFAFSEIDTLQEQLLLELKKGEDSQQAEEFQKYQGNRKWYTSKKRTTLELKAQLSKTTKEQSADFDSAPMDIDEQSADPDGTPLDIE